ncbi:hypothetical protein Tcan_18781 [Toxocara canis]|uniref:TIL domain-containing protein n=1 Tax=Toxocara canis TaxID=6265 RepID=A0A0B2VQF1_TOXCA|nr:hypothetical protein Tcan_18781 [Toxocara canis]
MLKFFWSVFILMLLAVIVSGYDVETERSHRLSLFCGPNESFSLCRKCERNCNGEWEADCTPGCGLPKCYCDADEGFVRSQIGGACIPLESCKSLHNGKASIRCFGISCPPGQYCMMMSSPFCVRPPCIASPKCIPHGMPPF